MYKLSNKKGALLGPINALIASTIVIAIILAIAFFFILVARSPVDIVDQKVSIVAFKQEASQSLIAYLHTPVLVSVDGRNQEMEMIDLIRLAKINSSYASVLKDKTLEIFDKVYPNEYGIIINGVVLVDYTMSTVPVTKSRAKEIQSGISYNVKIPNDIEVTLKLK